MKIEIIKAKEIKNKYVAGDVLVLGNPFGKNHFLLVENKDKSNVAAINLSNGVIDTQVSKVLYGFNGLVKLILEENDWDEWALVKSEDVSMTLDCKYEAIEQSNNSGSF